MSQDLVTTPVWDQLIADRGGRGPAEFEGHDAWDTSEEAAQAYARGVAEAQATAAEFWGRSKVPDAAPAGDAAGADATSTHVQASAS